MQDLKVRCYEAGLPDDIGVRNISAKDEQEAAERACGEPLWERGKPGQLRAMVWLSNNPGKKKTFFSPPRDIPN